jgi:hypothetical protein
MFSTVAVMGTGSPSSMDAGYESPVTVRSGKATAGSPWDSSLLFSSDSATRPSSSTTTLAW